jgi:hypothetical protein
VIFCSFASAYPLTLFRVNYDKQLHKISYRLNGVNIEGIRIEFIAITYFELFARQVEKAVFLSSVLGSGKVEVKTRLNNDGLYEALKIELED